MFLKELIKRMTITVCFLAWLWAVSAVLLMIAGLFVVLWTETREFPKHWEWWVLGMGQTVTKAFYSKGESRGYLENEEWYASDEMKAFDLIFFVIFAVAAYAVLSVWIRLLFECIVPAEASKPGVPNKTQKPQPPAKSCMEKLRDEVAEVEDRVELLREDYRRFSRKKDRAMAKLAFYTRLLNLQRTAVTYHEHELTGYQRYKLENLISPLVERRLRFLGRKSEAQDLSFRGANEARLLNSCRWRDTMVSFQKGELIVTCVNGKALLPFVILEKELTVNKFGSDRKKEMYELLLSILV